MSRTLRFGVLGCGVIGRVHAEVIAGLSDGELVAVADKTSERAHELAARHGVEAFPDLETMLVRNDLDVVTICIPSGAHAGAACAAMRHGVNVIVEKPADITLERIDRMLQVQGETGVKLAVVSQHRFDPAAQQVHSLVEAGELGRLVMGNAQVLWWRSQEYYDSGAWRGTWALDGGGVLMNQSIHTLDLLLWMMGPVRTVRAHTGTLAHQMETEDTATAVLQFASGALGTIAATTAAYPGVASRLEVLGDRGSAVIENDRLSFLHRAGEETGTVGSYGLAAAPAEGRETGENASSNPAAVENAAHAAQFEDMIASIREDRAPLVDGHAGRLAVQLILAIYESARTGREVRFE